MSKSAVLVTGGDKPPYPTIAHHIDRADWIIACDNGLFWCEAHGILPHHLVGDLDSVDSHTVKRYLNRGGHVTQLPTRKDLTDTAFGVEFCLKEGASHIALMGGTGGRLDHTTANLHLLYALTIKDVPAVMEGCLETVFCCKDRLVLEQNVGQTVSVMPAGSTCVISESGFRYPLLEKRIPYGTTLGISNVVEEPHATITVHQGAVFVYLMREDARSNPAIPSG